MASQKEIETALLQGDLEQAGKLIETRLLALPDDPDLIACRGQLHYARRNYAAAVSDLERALAGQPGRAEWQNVLGKSLNNLQRTAAAEMAFRSAIEAQPDFAEAWHNLGHVLRAQREHEKALDAFERAAQIDPSYAAAWHNAGLMRLLMDEPAAALEQFEKALVHEPDRPRLLVHAGVALHHLARYEKAIASYRRALEKNGDDAEAMNNLAISLEAAGHADEALATYRRASDLAPRDLQIRVKIAELLMSLGRAPEAMKITAECLKTRPGMTAALAVAAVADQEPGCRSPLPGLMNYSRLILHESLDPPDGQTLAEYNAALSEFVVSHPTLSFEPPGHATRKGSHTGNLLLGDKGPVAHLETRLADAVHRYAARMTEQDCRFMIDGMPPAWRLTMWSVVMESQGHQLPHIHPSAWLSGVYYAQIPAEIAAGDDSHAGWIEFGVPPESMHCKAVHSTVSFHPEAGEFYLFPGYFYHRTIPFRSQQRRICVAFDVIPDN